MAFDPDAYLKSVSSVPTPTDLDSEFDPDAYLKSVKQEGPIGTAVRSFVAGGASSALDAAAGTTENIVKVKDMASPTYYTPVPMMGMPTMSARQLEEEGIEAGKPIEEPETDLARKSFLQFAADLRDTASGMEETLGVDQDANRVLVDTAKGIGQFPVYLLSRIIGGPAGALTYLTGAMDSEALKEAESTTGKKFDEMSKEQQVSTNFTRLGYQIIGSALEKIGLSKIVPTALKSKVSKFLIGKGVLKKKEFTEVINSLRKDIAISSGTEFVTEGSQGFALDFLSKYSGLDSQRDIFSIENVKDNMYQAMIGAFSAGGTTTVVGGGGKLMAKIGNIEVPVGETPAVSETELGNKKQFSVKYTKDGQDIISDPIEADSLEDAQKIIEESVGKLDGVPKESIIVSEIKVEPEVDPIVEPEVETEAEPKSEVESLEENVLQLEEEIENSFDTLNAILDDDSLTFEQRRSKAAELRKQNKARSKKIEEAEAKIKELEDADTKKSNAKLLEDQAKLANQGKPRFEDSGIFGEDVDLDSLDLTPEQRANILAIREQVRAEAKEILTALDDTTEDTTAGASQLDPLNEFKVRRAQEQATKDAPYKPKRRKELYAKLRELDKRAFDALAAVNPYVRKRGYTPTSEQDYDSEIDMRLEDAAYMETVPQVSSAGVRSPIAGASPIQISNATTNRSDGRVVEEDGKVTKLVPDGEKLYEIKTRVTTSVRGSTKEVGKPSAEFQPVVRYVTAKSAKEASQKYKDTPDPAIDEQKKDSRANYPSNVQDQLSQRATSKVREIKDYDNNDKAIIRNLRDSSGFVFLPDTEFGIDPLIRGEQPIVGASTFTDSQIESDVEGEHGSVADTIVDGDVLDNAPVVGASKAIKFGNVKPITRSSLKGVKVFTFFADRMKVGTYTGLNKNSGIKIELLGGPGYAFIPANRKRNAGWAFSANMNFNNFNNRINTSSGIGVISLFAYDNLRANATFLKAYVAEVKYAIKTKKITKKRFLEVVNDMRLRALNKIGEKSDARPLFSKEFKSVEDFNKALETTTFAIRGNQFIKVDAKLGAKGLLKEGFPDISKMVDMFVDPKFKDSKFGDVVAAVDFEQGQEGFTDASNLGVSEHSAYPNLIKGKGIGGFTDVVNIKDLLQLESNKADPAVQAMVSESQDVIQSMVGRKLPFAVAASQKQQQSQQQGIIAEAVANLQKLADKLGIKVVARTDITRDAQYNYETQTIEYNPELLAKRGSEGSKAALREEAIHAAMHKVIMKRYPKLSARAAFEKAMANIGKDLTTEQKLLLQEVYGELDTDTDFGAEYSRFAIQQILDGKTTEGTMFEGKAMDKVKSLIKSVQSYLTRIMGPELESNKEAAFIIADSIKLLQSVDPNARPVNQKIVDKANSVLEGTNSLDSSRITNPANVPEGKLPSYQKRQIAKLLSQAGRQAKRFLQTASMFFRDIHVEIQTELVRHFNKIDTAQTEATRVLRSFQLGLIGIKNKKDKKRLQVLLTYSPKTDSVNNSERDTLINERNALLRKYNLLNDFNLLVRPLLDKLHQQAIASGQDVNYLFEYYPRRVKDLEGLMNYYGQAVSEDFVEYLKIENVRRGKAGEIQIVTVEQKAVELQKYLRKKSFVNSSKIPANFKTRTSNMLTEAELEFYEDSSKALGQYVSSVIVANAEQELLGKARNATTAPLTIDGKNHDVIDLKDSSGSLSLKIVELMQRGEIDETKFIDLQYGLTQLFGPNKSSENMLAEMSRTFSYGSLLVQPTTTLSQLYDIAFMSMDNNIARVMATLFTKKDFTLRMAGINTSTVSAEFVTDPKGKGVKKFMNDAVRTMLKAGGFTRMDQLLKETNLTTNYNRMKRVSKLSPNSRAYKNLRNELIYMQGETDADLTLGDLRQGIHDSPRVREAVVRKLLETQPINRLEMPLVVSDNPNTRMLYTMKSFVIKQANLVGNRYLAVIFSTKSSLGEKKDAILGLMYLAFLFQLVGFPIDILKALVSGRDIYQNDIATDGLFRIAGISSFTVGKFADDPFGTVASYFAPVAFSQGYQMSNDFIKVRDGEQSFMDPFLKLSPYSNVWYYRYGPGVFKEGKKRFYKRRAGELPIYRDDPLGDAVITPMKEAIYDPALQSIMDLIKQ